MSPALITPATKRVIKRMQEYRRRPMYFVATGYGRTALLVHDGVEFRRVDAFDPATFRQLLDHRLVEVSETSEDAPKYRGRKRLDSWRAESVDLTENGKAL
jgi:hypothetical protein